MPYNPRGAFTRLETIGYHSGVAFSKPRVLLMAPPGGSHNRRGKKRTSLLLVDVGGRAASCAFLPPRFHPAADLRFIRSADDARDYSSSVDVSYFATFGTYIIRRDDIGSSGTWRVRREARKTMCMWRTREKEDARVARGRADERRRGRQREGETG